MHRAALPGVRHPEGLHHGHLLLLAALRGLLHDVPHDPWPVGHQALCHLQHDGGAAILFFFFLLFFKTELCSCFGTLKAARLKEGS